MTPRRARPINFSPVVNLTNLKDIPSMPPRPYHDLDKEFNLDDPKQHSLFKYIITLEEFGKHLLTLLRMQSVIEPPLSFAAPVSVSASEQFVPAITVDLGLEQDPLDKKISEITNKNPPALPNRASKVKDKIASNKRRSAHVVGDLRFYKQYDEEKNAEGLSRTVNVLYNKVVEHQHQLETLKHNTGSEGGESLAEIREKLAAITTKLFDPNVDPQEQEQLNIEYEKLTSKMEKLPEYREEMRKQEQDWIEQNYQENKESYDQMSIYLQNLSPAQKQHKFQQNPLLALLETPTELIKRKHQNDWTLYSVHNLSLIEARAIYFYLPEFRNDQEKQKEFIKSLKAKIDTLKEKKPLDKPITGKPKVIRKSAVQGDGNSKGFLEELLKKRKAIN
eukprot:TRINITY_DN22923_c0_g1_i1.p1 TRINITY_DN22923_c0_g1~~TRINITY_DN22923_c0_g1_i1.p1  ORF type:complete len:447 (+),score=156.60 TRINITY_DN22923_c0_g1_i1:169-1341(+)